jgi:hypothetical protein
VGETVFNGVCFDKTGNICIAGNATSGLPFGNHLLVDSLLPLADVHFIGKISKTGQPLWASECSSSYGSYMTGGITRKPNGNYVLAGEFEGEFIVGIDTLPNNAVSDMYLAEFDSTGNPIGCVGLYGGGGYKSEVLCVKSSLSGDVYMGGAFKLSLYSATDTILYAGGGTDAFVAKYGSTCITGLEQQQFTASDKMIVYPNPVLDELNIQFDEIPTGKLQIRVNDLQGRELAKYGIAASKNCTLPVSFLKPGLYILSIEIPGSNKHLSAKFIKAEN